MSAAKIILMVFYAILTLVHLYCCYFKVQSVRKLTKPFLMLTLCVSYIVFTKRFDVLVPVALFLGMVGDGFLIFPEKQKLFMIGAVSFSLGHVLYILTLAMKTAAFSAPLWCVPVILVLPAVTIAVAFNKLKVHLPKELKPLMPVYFGLVGIEFTLAVMGLIVEHRTANVLLTVGAALFMTSDIILARDVFANGGKHGNFFVMLTYIAAQSLLCAGFVLRTY